jgi:group I intron endonuclease
VYKVYKIINKINNKIYIGSSQRNLEVRLQRHFSKANSGSASSLHKAIRKYGKENFVIELIEQFQTKKEMFEAEIKYISIFNTFKSDQGYNDTVGGEGGNTNGGKKFDDEWKVNISKSIIGKSNFNKRRFSQEVELEICRLYVEEENSTYALGKAFNCGRNLILAILDRNKIVKRISNYTGHKNGKGIFTEEQELEICNIFNHGKISIREISKQFNCGKTTIRDVLIRHNLLIKKG